MLATRDVLVVGAGISGLTAAFHLLRGGLDVVVVEADDRVGGAIRTARPSSREGSWIFERGPNTVVEGPAVERLLRDACLEDDRIVAAGAGKRRYVWKEGRLHPLPRGPRDLVTTELFPRAAKLRLLREPWIPRPSGSPGEAADESVADFARRRLGPAFLDHAVAPFVSGIYAGDPERLSARWAMPRLHALETRHGSLLRGALVARRGEGAEGGGELVSLDRGLDTLPLRLAEAVDDVRTGTPCRSLRLVGEGFEADTGDRTIRAREVVLAVPADATARILEPLTDGRSRALADVPYAPVAVASYGLRRDQVEHPLDGFGFLAPRRESLRILGCVFPSSLFPGRAPAGCVALTVFVGGRTDPEALEIGDDALHEIVLADLDRALGIRGQPVVRDLLRWPRAIPQYEVGHGRHVELGRAIEREIPRLHLLGSFLGGVSLSDCVRKGSELAGRILEEERRGVHRRL